jgi:hypothetical protein
VKLNVKDLLTYKMLCERWSVTINTVRLEVRRWQLSPVHFVGRQPFFLPDDVEAMEERRLRARSKLIGLCVRRGGK